MLKVPSSQSAGGHLYIIMELIEGAPLSEHITSLQEKKQCFTEQRLWKIFTQVSAEQNRPWVQVPTDLLTVKVLANQALQGRQKK